MCTPSPVREGTEKRLTENWKGGMNTEGGGEREREAHTQRREMGRWEMAFARIGDGNFCRSPLWLMLEQDVWLRKQGQEGRVLRCTHPIHLRQMDGWGHGPHKKSPLFPPLPDKDVAFS